MAEILRPMPKWILVVSWLVAVMEVMVGISLFSEPHSVIENLDIGAKGVTYVVQMWAVRQFALGIIFGYAALKKSTPMLTISYLFFLVMFVGDLLVGVLQHENVLIISALVMCTLSAGILWRLKARIKEAAA